MSESRGNVSVSAKYLLATGLWDAACEQTGMSPWAVNEGQMDRDEMVTLTVEQAEGIGLLPERRSMW